MRIVVNELVLALGYHEADLAQAAARRLKISPARVRLVAVIRRAVDARAMRPRPCYVVNAVFDVDAELDVNCIPKTAPYAPQPAVTVPAGRKYASRPVVVGCGPAGLAAAYYLARAGARPLLLERGQALPQRRPAVGAFWGRGILNPENNALYGEGGAGAFSDGKLTCRSKDIAGRDWVLRMLVAGGAPESVLYDSQAHLGSDMLAHIVPVIRQRIIEEGGEVRFGSRVVDFTSRDGRLQSLTVAAGREKREIPCAACLLATGHSADDVYQMLAARGVELTGKGFAIGVRLELPQNLVNRSQWGRFYRHPALGAASFFLTRQGKCHTFCMCPGGRVIATAAVPGTLGTNGMSLSPRHGQFANAAFLVPCESAANDLTGALATVAEIERQVFVAGGGDYSLPATTLAAFPNAAAELPERSCGRSRPADFTDFLPPPVIATLRECVPAMLANLGNPSPEQVVLYGAETRSTALVRVVRDENGESVSLAGLYPAGEGAGYAGGIVSSAIDGLRAAEKLLRQL